MQKFWTVSDLTKLIRIMAINQNTMDRLEGLFNLFLKPLLKYLHYLNQNSVKGSQINISKHYDLGNDFFSLFLDSTMMYSSAVFRSPQDSLYKGSIHKLETICQGLELTSQDHIIEIGSGWGISASTMLSLLPEAHLTTIDPRDDLPCSRELWWCICIRRCR